ncbi:uncharacterized protein EV154DRAFT_582757 [Mucor mucedo]|uniref:uncharacterized protein n=1 Tax=Mucor mucedo TaxID=29922 RepID=UPI00221FB2B4|nr:uncharacterized protein EV154DRAFT_582757 [Mucor mucedo]KAI7867478.1 hypothetical protein EV154DRAFT_582757 [Mucor mucedo]
METSLIKCLLPEEIMNLIFGYLEEKIDIKNCRLVCSSWNSSISSILYKEGIQIALCKRNYQRLQDDLVEFPELKMKVQRMYFISEDENYAGYDIDLNMFMPIINICKNNLKKLHFEQTTGGDNYLLPLIIETVDLPCIEEIVAEELLAFKPLTRKTYLKINYNYRSTITSLEISDFEARYRSDEFYYSDNEEDFARRFVYFSSPPKVYGIRYKEEWDKYPGLLNYVYNFRNLKVLKLLLVGIRDVIDITILTESNLLQLETLHICGDYSILCIANTPSRWSRINSCGFVKELTLHALEISVNTLEYIITNFSNVDMLNLYQKEPLKSYIDSSYGKEETPALIEKLFLYCKGKKYADIFLKYDMTEGETVISRQILRKKGQLIDEIRDFSFFYGYYDSEDSDNFEGNSFALNDSYDDENYYDYYDSNDDY